MQRERNPTFVSNSPEIKNSSKNIFIKNRLQCTVIRKTSQCRNERGTFANKCAVLCSQQLVHTHIHEILRRQPTVQSADSMWTFLHLYILSIRHLDYLKRAETFFMGFIVTPVRGNWTSSVLVCSGRSQKSIVSYLDLFLVVFLGRYHFCLVFDILVARLSCIICCTDVHFLFREAAIKQYVFWGFEFSKVHPLETCWIWPMKNVWTSENEMVLGHYSPTLRSFLPCSLSFRHDCRYDLGFQSERGGQDVFHQLQLSLPRPVHGRLFSVLDGAFSTKVVRKIPVIRTRNPLHVRFTLSLTLMLRTVSCIHPLAPWHTIPDNTLSACVWKLSFIHLVVFSSISVGLMTAWSIGLIRETICVSFHVFTWAHHAPSAVITLLVLASNKTREFA